MQEMNSKYLEALKIYLPYVVITALSYACAFLYNQNQILHNASKKEDHEQMLFWRDAFIKTNNAKNLRYENLIQAHVTDTADASFGK